jgi:pimeloyl-ACP methyl ester carboxylesterase
LTADKYRNVLSPKHNIYASIEDVETLPYPPNALPGARDVESPYGSIRVYEWGPEDGEKILLIHGISTPSIALTDLATKLVEKGFRVMLFGRFCFRSSHCNNMSTYPSCCIHWNPLAYCCTDLFSRGYSSGPSPHTHRYNSALYTSQIHICLVSSPLHWSTFSIIGYSLGGALAADFTSYFPQLVHGLVLVAPGGLVRRSHTTWKSRLLYSTSGLLPESWIERFVARRLYTGPQVARSVEPEPDIKSAETKTANRGDAVYASSHYTLLPENPHSTVGAVVDWQIKHHKGFVPAFISSIRYAPVHDEHARWQILGQTITDGSGKLAKIYIVLGETDPIIVKDEIIKDATECLGSGNVEFEVVKGAGHEVAIERADDVVRTLGKALHIW